MQYAYAHSFTQCDDDKHLCAYDECSCVVQRYRNESFAHVLFPMRSSFCARAHWETVSQLRMSCVSWWLADVDYCPCSPTINRLFAVMACREGFMTDSFLLLITYVCVCECCTCDWFHWVAQGWEIRAWNCPSAVGGTPCPGYLFQTCYLTWLEGWEIEVWKIHIQGCYIFRSSLWSSVLRWKRLYKKAPFQLWFRRISDRRGELQVTPTGPLFGFLAQLASQ